MRRMRLLCSGGELWHRLDAETRAEPLVAPFAPLVGPHMRGLCELSTSATDVLGLPVPACLLCDENTFPF